MAVRSTTQRAIWTRLAKPFLWRICETCDSTVRVLMSRRRAISLLLKYSATRRAYIPFEKQDAKGVAEVIRRVRGIANNTVNWDFAAQYQPKAKSFGGRLVDAIEIKPGIWGFKLDLKKLFEK